MQRPRPRMLDLYCGAGGAGMGYHRAGFDVVGVDSKPQPHYPFGFVEADALIVTSHLLRGGRIRVLPLDDEAPVYSIEDFDCIHASPPCQAYSRATAWRGDRASHPDLIAATRTALEKSGKPFVIENVQEARHLLRLPIMLCGSLFGLRVQRHRYFEAPSLPLLLMEDCRHRPDDFSHDHGFKQTEAVYRDALGCQWMTVHEARQAVPPAYTEFLGARLLKELEGRG